MRFPLIRLYLLVALLIMLWLYWTVPRLQPSPRQWLKQRAKPILLWLSIALVTILLLTGRLNILIALLGFTGALFARLIPLLLKYAPYLQRLWIWRQQQQKPTAAASPMTREQALAILGLDSQADAQAIRQAHQRLIARLHPDKGGSDYLAAQLNLAKQTLLGGE